MPDIKKENLEAEDKEKKELSEEELEATMGGSRVTRGIQGVYLETGRKRNK